MFDLDKLLRKNIKQLKHYSSARGELYDQDAILLDANENPFNTAYNRYPDPLQLELKKQVSELKEISADNIFLGNGSDEAIELLIKAFCNPGKDNIITLNPTFGMYEVCAKANEVEVRKVNLLEGFGLDKEKVLEITDDNTKIIFICSPNNPTANSFSETDILDITEKFDGLVVIDEAYIDFSSNKSFISYLNKYQNLVVIQTLSKAWGLAGTRLGMAFSESCITDVLNKIKSPYNINSITQDVVLDVIKRPDYKTKYVSEILKQKEYLKEELIKLDIVENVFPSDTNFLLVKFSDAVKVYDYLIEKRIFVRNRSKDYLCENCLRVTVGTSVENQMLINNLKQFASKEVQADQPEGRVSTIERNTNETKIKIELNIDGQGNADIDTGLGFFDHMLEQIARHSQCDLKIKTKGDLFVDEHHTIEDTAIALGEAFYNALGEKRGIERYGFCLPMDDCLALVALDFGGRNWIEWNVEFNC